MGSNMTTEGCISLGSERRTGPVITGSTLWSRKNRGVVASWRRWWLMLVELGWVRVKIGWPRSRPMLTAVRTQMATAGNTTMARVLDGCNSPSLPMSGVSNKSRVRPFSDHCAEYLWLQFRAQHLGLNLEGKDIRTWRIEMVAICERETSKDF